MSDSATVVRTRFAPSPTGFLHVGGARTALFSYLFARHMQGEFILRVEDTDQERSTEASIQAILEGMAWLGLDYDEGPYFQTDRFDRYREVVDQLLSAGKAYRCCCSKQRLEELRAEQMKNKQKPRYDGCCRDVQLGAESSNCVVRFKNPLEGEVTFVDAVRGHITVKNAELDDLIIARSDGTPTYNLTVVVDDAEMQITHVVRGDDHINNTPRQINLFAALDYTPPQYAHVPMILGGDGKRLSKRHGAVSVLQYRDMGILPEALLNYLVRLGWAHGDQEVFSCEQMRSLFTLDAVNKSPACFDEGKLLWLNQHYMKTLPAEVFLSALKQAFVEADVDVTHGPPLEAIVEMQKERVKTLNEMVERSVYFFQDFTEFDQKAAKKNLKETSLQPLQTLRERFSNLEHWQQEDLHQVVVDVAAQLELKLGKVAQPLRVAVTGTAVSPPIDETLLNLGRDTVLRRLDQVIVYIGQLPLSNA